MYAAYNATLVVPMQSVAAFQDPDPPVHAEPADTQGHGTRTGAAATGGVIRTLPAHVRVPALTEVAPPIQDLPITTVNSLLFPT